MLREVRKPRFSIIIPAYNVENYIEKAINSVKSQTFKNFEIIIVEDCSTDNTKEVIKKYKKEATIIYHKKNKCLGGARNSGIKVARGEYIVFLDSDDYLNNNEVLEKLDKLIGKQTVDVIYMGFVSVGKKEFSVIPTKETCNRSYRISGDRYTNAWSKCWNTQFLLKNNLYFPENRYYEDVLFIFNAISKVEDYLIADFPVHTYVSGRNNSITSRMSFKNIQDNLKNIEDLVNIRRQLTEKDDLDAKLKKEVQRCKERLEQLIEEIGIK